MSLSRRIDRRAKQKTKKKKLGRLPNPSECPACGAPITRNDRERTLSHEAPECAWFASKAAELGAERS